VGVVVVAGVLAGVSGCSTPTEGQPADPPPAATFRGPAYLRGTVGSLATVQNFNPLPVGGYGLVVGLDGTGSSGVPSYLREDILSTMRKRGVGSARFQNHPLSEISPDQLLAREDTAVVVVRGLIPPGASEGTRFDVLISALQGTQTTSLVGGRLWMTELGTQGTRPGVGYFKPLAEASGDTYVNPFDRREAKQNPDEFVYHALVVAGGEVTEDRSVRLRLNRPSYTRARLITDRINERFPSPPEADARTAEAQTQLFVDLNIPPDYRSRPREFVRLVQHLYTQRAPDFVTNQAQRLAEEVKQDPAKATAVSLAWQALGKGVIPIIRRYYEADSRELRLAALEAGARLEDERASQSLDELADHDDPAVRQAVAESLVHLPESLTGSRTLRRLLDDETREVRITAYESLAAINDPILDRAAVRSASGEVKYLIDRVPADKPLVYVTPERIPRVVIFKPDLGFSRPVLARIWNNHLMLKGQGDKGKVKLFYQRSGRPQAHTEALAPNVGRLAYYLGHEPSSQRPEDGLGLSYSQVVDALYQLCEDGSIPSPVKVKVSDLAQLVEDASRVDPRRPEAAPGPSDMVDSPATQPATQSSEQGVPTARRPTPVPPEAGGG